MFELLTIVAALHLEATPGQHGHIRFQMIAIEPGRVRTVQFSESENHYDLVTRQSGGDWSTWTPLGIAAPFSLFQSTETFPLPRGEYAIVERRKQTHGIVLDTMRLNPLVSFWIEPGEWVIVGCAAEGVAQCHARLQEGVSEFR